MYVPYDELIDTSRIWIFQSDRKFEPEEVYEISDICRSFVDGWVCHGKNVKGSFSIVYDQFLIFAVDESFVKISGCSIDSAKRLVQKIGSTFKLDLLNKLNIAFRDQNEKKISIIPLLDFKKNVELGKITENTIVFNNLIDKKSDFLTRWEIPVKKSWHVQFFK